MVTPSRYYNDMYMRRWLSKKTTVLRECTKLGYANVTIK